MDVLTVLTVLIVSSAAFSYLNERYIKLPGTVGVVTLSVGVSVLIVISGETSPALAHTIGTFTGSLDFSTVLLDVMLGFLLFASGLHVDYYKLKEQRLPVFMLSTLSVVLSTGVFGVLLYAVTRFTSIPIPPLYCFLFGALISPTDPIAVGSILKTSKIPPRLHTIISGESMFNDGVGLLLFIVLLTLINQSATITLGGIVQLFVREVLGGILIGAVMGYVGYRLIRSIAHYQTILLLSVALVLSLSLVAHQFHASIPLTAVTAGLIFGNENLSEQTPADRFLTQIWQLIDDVLNTILFAMIGLQLVAMPFLATHWLIGLLSIGVALITRVVSVSLPSIMLLGQLNVTNLLIVTWAGLRGGISIAMALTLPASPYRETILSGSYLIVIFSIIVQGLTLNTVIAKAVNRV